MRDTTDQLLQALALAQTILRDGEPADGWPGKRYLIGMHGEWLTEAEADQKMISFPQITDAEYYTRYLVQEAKLVRFFLALHQANSLLVMDETAEQFVVVGEAAKLVQLITLGTRELRHYIVYSPALHAVFVDGFDVASVAYALPGKENDRVRAFLRRLAQANGLFVLH